MKNKYKEMRPTEAIANFINDFNSLEKLLGFPQKQGDFAQQIDEFFEPIFASLLVDTSVRCVPNIELKLSLIKGVNVLYIYPHSEVMIYVKTAEDWVTGECFTVPMSGEQKIFLDMWIRHKLEKEFKDGNSNKS